MSLLSVLKSVGKDLSHVGTWIEDGLKSVEAILPVAGEVATMVDPPLGPLVTEIETIVGNLQKPSAAMIQAVSTSVATLAALKSPTPIVIPAAVVTTTTVTPAV